MLSYMYIKLKYGLISVHFNNKKLNHYLSVQYLCVNAKTRLQLTLLIDPQPSSPIPQEKKEQKLQHFLKSSVNPIY